MTHSHPPASDDALERTRWFQAGLVALICYLWLAVLVGRGYVTGWGILLAVIVVPGVAWGVTTGARRLAGGLATGLIGSLHAGGGVRYQHGYSAQETLIARGRYDEAAESFAAHLAEHPGDVVARLRLATLHLRERQDPAAAEAQLLAVRRHPHDRGQALLVGNHLVDIYRAQGQRGKLMAELTRMMREFPGSPAAAGAERLLAEVRSERAAGD